MKEVNEFEIPIEMIYSPRDYPFLNIEQKSLH